MKEPQMKVLNTNEMPWEEEFDQVAKEMLYQKKLVTEEESGGMRLYLITYPAGYYNGLHTHPCAHGIYILKGHLRTDKGVFGPGEFVWHPEGVQMRHGAPENEDCVMLFVTNKKFDFYPVK